MPPSAKCQAPPLRDVAAQLRRLQENPADFRLHLGIATALFAAGLRKEALATLQHAGALAARDSARWREIASVLTQAGARAPAITALQQALAIEPTHRPTRLALAGLLRDDHRTADALALLAPLLPEADAAVLRLHGQLCSDTGDFATASASFGQAHRLRPSDTGLALEFARSCARAGRAAEGLVLARSCTQVVPDAPIAWLIRGLCAEDLAEAETSFRRALKLNPKYVDAANQLARRLCEAGRATEALAELAALIAGDPDNAEAHHSRGIVLERLDRLPEAYAAFGRAVALNPAHADARKGYNACGHTLMDRALALLHAGDFTAGWAAYEWRRQSDQMQPHPYARLPSWPADQPRHGHLLVWSEQGIGDEIMFTSLLPLLIPLVDRITLACNPRLQPLFARSFPGIVTIAQPTDPREPHRVVEADWQIPIGSIPARFWSSSPPSGLGQVPLQPDPARVAELRTRYGAERGPLVGLSWFTKNARNGAERSVPPEDLFAACHDLPAQFVSLQYGDTATARTAASAAGVDLLCDNQLDTWNDLDGFAAQIAAMDAVLTIDNSTVHFAGALGRPTWLLVPTPADWRWRAEGDTTPWYPSVHIHRRAAGSGWSPVVGQALTEINAALACNGF